MYIDSIDSWKVLVLDDIHSVFFDELKVLSITATQYLKIEQADLKAIIADFEIIVVNSKTKLDKALIDEAKKLKYILRPGSGMENVDVAYAESKKIVCINSPEGNSNAVAEHVMGMMLNWFRNIRKANEEVRNGIWLRKENTGEELSGKTIGIIGYGHTGSRLAKLATTFEMKVLVYDKYKSGFGNDEIEECSLEKIFQQANIISFHVPLNEETKYMVDEVFFQQIKLPILLVNVSRGKVVKNAALLKALAEEKISGACLDVLENEQLNTLNALEKNEFELLAQNEKILITPHIAGWTNKAKYSMAAVLVEKLKKNLKIN